MSTLYVVSEESVKPILRVTVGGADRLAEPEEVWSILYSTAIIVTNRGDPS